MSTRATIRFATREEGVSFNEHPENWNTQFYRHSDGYPEGLGVEIAESIIGGSNIAMEIENPNIKHGDIDYIYYVWQAPKKDMWISIFEVAIDSYCEHCFQYTGKKGEDKCIFVGEPQKLINKYKINTNDEG